jgi:hypothetical protein
VIVGRLRQASPPSGVADRYADAGFEIEGGSDFFFLLFDQRFTRKLADLPKAASVPDDKIPYSGYYYPQRSGGTSQRLVAGQLSPLEKYDRAFNSGQPLATNWEKTKHTVSANDPSAPWAGHCNGFGAAAQRHRRPLQAVTRGGVRFETYDIRALLAEVYMSAKYLFLGGRRCESESNPPSPGARTNPTEMGECEDVNPATFHLALANWIGKMRHTLVFDYTASYQVWNYPLYKYSSTETPISKEEAMRQVTGSPSATYRFNPRAVSFVQVVMVVTNAEALGQEILDPNAPNTQPVNRTYQYVLEIDGAGNVIGGEWTTQSQANHPDFLWVAFEPVLGNGNSLFANPHVAPNEVIKLWAESIGADPNNPPLDILEPTQVTNWGRFADFDVILDGLQTGAVFLGKKIHIGIIRRGNLTGAVTVDLLHNGYPLTTLQGDGSQTLEGEFEPVPGLNRLTLTFKKSGSQVERQYVGFHAVP